MSIIFAIDPGNVNSGFCLLDSQTREIGTHGVTRNEDLLRAVATHNDADVILAIEMMRPRGMPFSIEAMHTLIWVGRFTQAWIEPKLVKLVDRIDVKMHLCGTAKAKDKNVRQALIDIYGPPGLKKKQGPTYGITSHVWPALGVATTFAGIR